MATLPQRKDSARRVIGSLLPQVDELHVFKGDNEYGDANKFRGLTEKGGFLFTVDDDLEFPSDYVEFMIRKILQYDKKAVISLHGKILRKPKIDSFYGNDFIKFRCLDQVKRDTPVHIPGTGCMAWHSDTIQFSMDDFPKKNMADIWAGIKCEKENVPRVCVAHEKNWVKNINNDDSTIFKENKKRDDILTDAINSIQWEPLMEKSYDKAKKRYKYLQVQSNLSVHLI